MIQNPAQSPQNGLLWVQEVVSKTGVMRRRVPHEHMEQRSHGQPAPAHHDFRAATAGSRCQWRCTHRTHRSEDGLLRNDPRAADGSNRKDIQLTRRLSATAIGGQAARTCSTELLCTTRNAGQRPMRPRAAASAFCDQGCCGDLWTRVLRRTCRTGERSARVAHSALSTIGHLLFQSACHRRRRRSWRWCSLRMARAWRQLPKRLPPVVAAELAVVLAPHGSCLAAGCCAPTRCAVPPSTGVDTSSRRAPGRQWRASVQQQKAKRLSSGMRMHWLVRLQCLIGSTAGRCKRCTGAAPRRPKTIDGARRR